MTGEMEEGQTAGDGESLPCAPQERGEDAPCVATCFPCAYRAWIVCAECRVRNCRHVAGVKGRGPAALYARAARRASRRFALAASGPAAQKGLLSATPYLPACSAVFAPASGSSWLPCGRPLAVSIRLLEARSSGRPERLAGSTGALRRARPRRAPNPPSHAEAGALQDPS